MRRITILLIAICCDIALYAQTNTINKAQKTAIEKPQPAVIPFWPTSLNSKITEMSNIKYDNPVEQKFHDDLYGYLRTLDLVDERMPEAPDLDDLWFKIGQSYMADGIREYNTGYPSVALGWMMFIGMAVAKYWDVEWEVYGKVPDLYVYLRDRIDFDHMDDYILDKVLCLDADSRKKMNDAVAESASRTYNMMSHMCLESGTAAAMRAFTAALHQMYVMGVAVELKALGYHMTKL